MAVNPFDSDSLATVEPDSIVAGSYVAWKRLLDYDSASYALRYDLVPRGDSMTLPVSGTRVADGWTFEVASVVTGAWLSGEYRYNLVLIRASDSEEAIIESGQLTVFGSTQDRRTHAEVMVGKINSLLEGRADHDIESYTIKSRSITRMSVSELRQWRDYYLDEIARTGGSTTRQGSAPSNTLRVRFVQ